MAKTKEIKIEIKNRFTGKILFEYSKVDNTLKNTVVEATEKVLRVYQPKLF